MFKPRLAAKGKNVKRKVTATHQESTADESKKSKVKAKKSTNSHTNSNSNDSNPTVIKKRKVEKPEESKAEEVDTSKDNVTIFLSNLEFR